MVGTRHRLLLLPLLLLPLLVQLVMVQGFLVTPSTTQRSTARAPRSPLRPQQQQQSANDAAGTAASSPQPPPLQPPQQALRQVALVKRFARLPFWPIWHGLVIMLLDQVRPVCAALLIDR